MSSHAAHRSNQTRLGAALGLVVRFVFANGVEQMIPFELIRIGLLRRAPPNYVVIIDSLPLEYAAFGWRMAGSRNHRCRLGSMRIAGEFSVSTGDAPPIEIQLRSVGKGVFDRIAVKILIDIVSAVVPTTRCLGFHWPGIFH